MEKDWIDGAQKKIYSVSEHVFYGSGFVFLVTGEMPSAEKKVSTSKSNANIIIYSDELSDFDWTNGISNFGERNLFFYSIEKGYPIPKVGDVLVFGSGQRKVINTVAQGPYMHAYVDKPLNANRDGFPNKIIVQSKK